MIVLFIVQAVLCALIALRLLLFTRDGAAHRPWASRLAYGLIVLAGAVPIGVLSGRYDWALLAQNGIMAVLCLAVFAVRGNVVELFRMAGDADASRLVRFLRRTPR
ncbi:phage holin family protein [Ralstonia pseudosolanacearum]|uniref:phage holin family protein n=1 Tax=Ralstonia pseudosolanacearum TaxID=1310165 RepID=UPI001FFBB129|nr:phage holin family protein [Ralstonia pseudosolanacearum]MDC6285481.1 phage holin family protein [Ralstonia pseudosolanacearum]